MKQCNTLKSIVSTFLFLIVSVSIQAQIVTSNLDDGSIGTLRNQISTAASGSEITFDASVTNIVLTAGQITIDKTLTITGNGSSNTTIDGNAGGRIFDIINGDVLIKEIKLTNGLDSSGGAIQVAMANLFLTNTLISNNVANGTNGTGGAILVGNGATFTATDSILSGNIANKSGGAIEAIAGSTNTLTNVNLISNNAGVATSGIGGGISNAGRLKIVGGTINNNIAATEGGGLWNSGITIISGDVTGDVIIDGNIASGDASNNGGGGIFNSGDLNITKTVIKNNTANGTNGSGGGILNIMGASLTVLYSTISTNTANSAGGGIEINTDPSVTVDLLHSYFVDNNAGVFPAVATPGNGGGIHVTNGSVFIDGGNIDNNTAATQGGGIWNSSGTMTVNGANISGNTAAGTGTNDGGGGIYNFTSGTLNINNCEINNNMSATGGGGLWNGTGTMTIDFTTIDGNTASGAAANDGGGGIFNNGGSLLINSSTLSNNKTDGTLGNGGGLLLKTGTATIVTSTISGNSSLNNGAGIYNNGTLTLNALTIANNNANINGGGIANYSGIAPTLKNTIVATNTATTGNDLYTATGVFNTNGYNLIGDDTTNAFPATATDIESSNPLLSILADNGGSTYTHALQTNSPAYDKGDVADTFVDQRGSTVFGTSRDIGSYESQTALGIESVPNSDLKRSLVYPNPTSIGMVTIVLASGYGDNIKGQLIEIGTGKVVKEFNIASLFIELKLDGISNGFYIIKLLSDSYCESHKLIIGL